MRPQWGDGRKRTAHKGRCCGRRVHPCQAHQPPHTPPSTLAPPQTLPLALAPAQALPHHHPGVPLPHPTPPPHRPPSGAPTMHMVSSRSLSRMSSASYASTAPPSSCTAAPSSSCAPSAPCCALAGGGADLLRSNSAPAASWGGGGGVVVVVVGRRGHHTGRGGAGAPCQPYRTLQDQVVGCMGARLLRHSPVPIFHHP